MGGGKTKKEGSSNLAPRVFRQDPLSGMETVPQISWQGGRAKGGFNSLAPRQLIWGGGLPHDWHHCPQPNCASARKTPRPTIFLSWNCLSFLRIAPLGSAHPGTCTVCGEDGMGGKLSPAPCHASAAHWTAPRGSSASPSTAPSTMSSTPAASTWPTTTTPSSSSPPAPGAPCISLDPGGVCCRGEASLLV